MMGQRRKFFTEQEGSAAPPGKKVLHCAGGFCRSNERKYSGKTSVFF
jgi:hypothetical protein